MDSIAFRFVTNFNKQHGNIIFIRNSNFYNIVLYNTEYNTVRKQNICIYNKSMRFSCGISVRFLPIFILLRLRMAPISRHAYIVTTLAVQISY